MLSGLKQFLPEIICFTLWLLTQLVFWVGDKFGRDLKSEWKYRSIVRNVISFPLFALGVIFFWEDVRNLVRPPAAAISEEEIRDVVREAVNKQAIEAQLAAEAANEALEAERARLAAVAEEQATLTEQLREAEAEAEAARIAAEEADQERQKAKEQEAALEAERARQAAFAEEQAILTEKLREAEENAEAARLAAENAEREKQEALEREAILEAERAKQIAEQARQVQLVRQAEAEADAARAAAEQASQARDNSVEQVVLPEQVDTTPFDLNRHERIEAQKRLSSLRLYSNEIDGVFGQKTQEAIAKFQLDQAYPVTGALTEQQFEKLRDLSQTSLIAWEENQSSQITGRVNENRRIQVPAEDCIPFAGSSIGC